MPRHVLIFLAAVAAMLPSAALAQMPERVESLITRGGEQGQFLAVVGPVKKRDGSQQPISEVRLRRFGGGPDAWEPYARFDGAVLALAGREGDLAVLLAIPDSVETRTQLRYVYNPLERGARARDVSGPPPPEGLTLLDIAGGSRGARLFALGQSGSRREIWALGGPSWQRLPELPPELSATDQPTPELAAVGDRPLLAVRAGDQVRIFSPGESDWQPLGTVEVAAGERFLLIESPDAGMPPVLYVYGADDRLVKLGNPEDQPIVMPVAFLAEGVAEVGPEDPRGAAVAMGSLRLIRSALRGEGGEPDERVLLELALDLSTLQPAGDGRAVPLTFLAVTQEEFRHQLLQLALYALLIVALVSVLRQRPLPPAERLRDVRAALAPLSLRSAAGMIDLLPLAFAIALWWVAQERLSETAELVVLGIGMLAYFGHLIVAETLTGRSLGKAMFGLKVVRTDGSAPGVAAILLRNILRPADALTAGLGLALMSPLYQRLGDLAAGTTVVRVLAPDREG